MYQSICSSKRFSTRRHNILSPPWLPLLTDGIVTVSLVLLQLASSRLSTVWRTLAVLPTRPLAVIDIDANSKRHYLSDRFPPRRSVTLSVSASKPAVLWPTGYRRSLCGAQWQEKAPTQANGDIINGPMIELFIAT